MTTREQLDRLTTAKEELLLVLRSLDTEGADCDEIHGAHKHLNNAVRSLEKAQNLITDAARTPEFWDLVKEKLTNGATGAQEEPTS